MINYKSHQKKFDQFKQSSFYIISHNLVINDFNIPKDSTICLWRPPGITDQGTLVDINQIRQFAFANIFKDDFDASDKFEFQFSQNTNCKWASTYGSTTSYETFVWHEDHFDDIDLKELNEYIEYRQNPEPLDFGGIPVIPFKLTVTSKNMSPIQYITATDCEIQIFGKKLLIPRLTEVSCTFDGTVRNLIPHGRDWELGDAIFAQHSFVSVSEDGTLSGIQSIDVTINNIQISANTPIHVRQDGSIYINAINENGPYRLDL